MSNRKIVLWVTHDSYVDHDIDVVPLISKIADIHWLVMLPYKNGRFKEEDFAHLDLSHNKKIHFIKAEHRARYPQNISFYNAVFNLQKELKADIIHLDIGVDNPWALPLFLKLHAGNTVVTLHQGAPHEGMNNHWLCNFLRNIIFHKFKYVKMFSKSQHALFETKFFNKRVFEFTLPLLRFGEPSITRKDDGVIRFLSFGSINYAKHIDLLLDAACNLYEQGYKNIRVKIAGKCGDWQTTYKPHIKYPEIIEEEIRMIDNSEIPNLFTDADYFVQPYRVISQSGPFKIAMQYNLPLITSDLPGFTDEMVEGVTGYTFKTNDVKSLEEVMIKAIKMKEDVVPYADLKDKMKAYVEKTYAPDALVKQYADMFNEIAK